MEPGGLGADPQSGRDRLGAVSDRDLQPATQRAGLVDDARPDGRVDVLLAGLGQAHVRRAHPCR